MGEGVRFSDAEIALTSFETKVNIFRHRTNHCNKSIGGRIHPTEKPIELYEWILHHYAKEGDKILDTHLGSGSIAIACHNLKYDLTACEVDKDYYDAAMKRLERHRRQLQLYLVS